MCGIVGIIGQGGATETLVQGLKKLEYRGYDSAGIFIHNTETDYLIKSVGRIAHLEEKLAPEIDGTMGIGHTRWATHGKPTEENAHPHQSSDGRFVLVHNGVIENYQELKQLLSKGVLGEDCTDTQIVVELISQLVAQHQLDAKEGLRQVLTLIKGSYAFALVDKKNPEAIYLAKNKSPLLIGVGEDFHGCCSDAMAMIEKTNQFVEIKDGEIVVLTKSSYQIESLAGEKVERAPYTAELDSQDLEKGTYEHYMLKEMEEQPAVIRRILSKYLDEHGNLTISKEVLDQLKASDRIYIVACGTSYHAGLVGKKLFETLTHIPTEVHIASEFGYHMPLLTKSPFFIFLSQSGETADSRQVLVQVADRYPTLTMTNTPGSTLSREASHTLLLHAGPEIAVASTKAYTAQLAVLAILANVLGQSLQNELALSFDLAHELSLVASGLEEVMAEKGQFEELAKEVISDQAHAFYIGRGLDYYVALEAALKLKEISYVHCEGYAAGELKHGPIALIENETPVIALLTEASTLDHTRGNMKEVESRGARVISLVSEQYATEQDTIVLPKVHSLLTPLITVLPTQYLAYYTSLNRGLDVDKPRNLAKSVTVE
ncbi:glutamine--fructose-6-phosphate transaminase (isomerizing) [Vagococcus humatus]|uniref:Glutamine--fructose-6-phosphate aminotransferase [isomerizing] n=1 Tax=Vagococcus humatus TaxID=1889241 RepID=A0A429Z8R7_9ENTE|nr:glutamine--fructose-6-phosphate transaminase (isomerizing) [Vagococcus humatus]RST90072.1 glutamine--fructose-6-phosphate transaminase (isomerizing) [Vagococcus humatus]